MRLVELRRGAEVAAIDRDRLIHRGGREVRGKGVWQPERGGELRTEQAGAQNPQRHLCACARGRADPRLPVIGEIALQFHHVARERLRIAFQRAAKRARYPLVRSRRASQPQIDPAGIQRVERAELFGDHQRRMVGQHDPARADTDRLRLARNMADHHRRRGARNARHAMMFGDPIARIAAGFGLTRQIGGVGQSGCSVTTFDNGDEVEQGISSHARSDNVARRAIPVAAPRHKPIE